MNRIAAGINPIDLCHIRFSAAERRSLRRLYAHGDLRARRLCVDYLRDGAGVRANRRFIFEMCERLIPDRATHLRWQALLILGRFAQSHPRELWPLVVKWGSDANEDIRTGVACCVLEHILEYYHFVEFFAEAKRVVLAGNRRFARTLSQCYEPDLPRNGALFRKFVAEHCPVPVHTHRPRKRRKRTGRGAKPQ